MLRIIISLIIFSAFHGNQAIYLSPYCNDAYSLYFSTYLSTNMQFLRSRMEFNQVIPRLLHQREQQSEVKVPRRSRNVSHHHAARPIIHCRIRNMHVIALKPLPNNPSHVFGRCEVSRHVPNDWNVRHRRVNRCRNDHTHKHVVVSHNPAKSFTVAHHSDLRGAVEWIHGLAAQAGGRGDDSDLPGTTSLHTRKKWEDCVKDAVYVDRKDFCCHLGMRKSVQVTVAMSSVLPQSGIITAALAITKSI